MMQRLKKFLKHLIQPPNKSNDSWEELRSRHEVPAQNGPILRSPPSTDTQKMRIYKAMDLAG